MKYKRNKKGQFVKGFPHNKGIKRTEETRKKVSEAKKGVVPWNKGKKMSSELRKKLSESHKGKFLGKKHPNWKGGKPSCIYCGKTLSRYDATLCGKCAIEHRVISEETKMKTKESMLDKNTKENSGYDALHKWVYVRLGRPDTCEHCGANGLSGKKIHWANKSGEYKREVDDWLRLCPKCHRKYDLQNGFMKSQYI